MDIANLQAYAYVIVTGTLVVILYAYIYHLYKVRKDASGRDYEDYADLALKDDIDDTPVSSVSKEK